MPETLEQFEQLCRRLQSEAAEDWRRKRDELGPRAQVTCYHGTAAEHDPIIRRDGLALHWRRPGDRVDNQPEPYVAAHPLRAVCYAIHAVASRQPPASDDGVVY